MLPGPDDVAACALAAFDALPAKCKPRARDPAAREWVPLAALVLSKSTVALSPAARDVARLADETARADGGAVTCAALGTGMKCLPAAKVPGAHGVVLHDWHAEILALRAFSRFLIDECRRLVSSSEHVSQFVRFRAQHEVCASAPQPFALKDDVQIHMYCSEAPCGDASMELTMDAQDDATPWTLPAENAGRPGDEATAEVVLRGRGYFSELGIVRRKPARPDAPPTLSKSCTDKIALKQCTSLLNAAAVLLVDPCNVYIRTLVLPESQRVSSAVTRAFSGSGRMSDLTPETTGAWPSQYSFQPFEVQTISREFEWSRRSGQPGQKLIPCNLSALYTPHHAEVIINGALQGRKQGDVKGASAVSRRALWKAAVEVALLMKDRPAAMADHVDAILESKDYAAMKKVPTLLERERVKDATKAVALKGWARNVVDDSFGLE